jgi:NAD(P)-dependent dehydrogenase (short-subunit alcohol dehydrogenase family)
MKLKLQDRTAVITGASKGIGRAMALALAAEGARIALVSRDREKLTAVADEITAAEGRAAVFPADVTSEADVRRVECEILALYPKVNIVINNAGVNVRKPVVDFTLEEWHRVMDTNVTAAFLMCRSFVPAMVGHGYGRILNMTSIMSHVSLPGRIAYATSKTALLGMTRTLALELDHRSLNTDTFDPIYVLMGHALPEEAQSRPVQRAGDAQGGVHPQVSNRGETAHSSCSVSFGFVIRPE